MYPNIWIVEAAFILSCHKKQFIFFFEKHKQELEDMRKAGHEALSIIVDEYKVVIWESVSFFLLKFGKF